MQDQEIDPETVEEGDVVQYENKYHAAAVVEVLNVEFEDRENDQYQTVDVEVLEPIFGSFGEGETITLGRTTDESLQHYIDWKLKNPGVMTDYVNAGSLEEHRHKIIEINETYGS
jgi:TPP-dependent trihydroxycyclohexane-1,2-dione (THcHDO) dehydratase